MTLAERNHVVATPVLWMRLALHYAGKPLPPPRVVARAFGCSRASSYRWVALLADARGEVLARRPRAPRLTMDQVREALRLRAIGWTCLRVGKQLGLGKSTIHKLCQRQRRLAA